MKSAEAALQITVDFYPDEPVSPRSAAVLHELFDLLTCHAVTRIWLCRYLDRANISVD